MLASELVGKLLHVIAGHGDLPVIFSIECNKLLIKDKFDNGEIFSFIEGNITDISCFDDLEIQIGGIYT